MTDEGSIGVPGHGSHVVFVGNWQLTDEISLGVPGHGGHVIFFGILGGGCIVILLTLSCPRFMMSHSMKTSLPIIFKSGVFFPNKAEGGGVFSGG